MFQAEGTAGKKPKGRSLLAFFQGTPKRPVCLKHCQGQKHRDPLGSCNQVSYYPGER